MTILGIGVDILHLPRLRQALSRHPKRFVTRILTKIEQDELQAIRERTGDKDTEAVEACYKAAFPHHKLTWQDVTVVKENGKPCLKIPERERFGIGNAHASVSHDGDFLISQVIFEKP
ncbi:hypothetical protein BGZ98_002074 [Dissophora globulifera]|nr:hypothetical protein BGZ98_002074 [Dissophora globulifera]